MRYLRLLSCKEIKAKLLDLPMIVADATLPLEIVKHFLPNLEVACDIKVEAPHMRITQVIGLPVGKASLQPLPPGKRSADEEERVGRKRQRLADACRHQVAGRRGLVITYKSIEVDFADIEGVEVGHFNAIEGIDRWRGVEMLVTIGRPLPQPEHIQDMAAAITGKPVVAGDTVEADVAPADPGMSSSVGSTASRQSRWSGRPSPRRQSSRQSGEHEASTGPRPIRSRCL